jgi:glycosyltransferase involved in cell wall biosynthesis
VHILEHGKLGRYRYAKALRRCLATIRPQVVYSLGAIGFLPLQAALHLPHFKYKLFTGNHTSAEAFPLARAPRSGPSAARLIAFATRWLPGRLVSLLSEHCYCRSAGCADIAGEFFGVQRHKLKTVPLGVDTELFFPVSSEAERAERSALRAELGFAPDEIVCVNSGRMIAAKDLQLLIAAIAQLRGEGLAFRGLFIGDGPERARLVEAKDCVVLPFLPFKELGRYYRAAEIGVWPAGESTSMFDATSCGLPLVVSDRIDAQLAGNGLSFRTHELAGLTAALRSLADPGVRARLGSAGSRQLRAGCGWEHAARVRMRDFRAALAPPSRR